MDPVPPPGTTLIIRSLTLVLTFTAYNPNLAPPPTYMPPDGGSKTNPHQHMPATRIGESSQPDGMISPPPQGPSAPAQVHHS